MAKSDTHKSYYELLGVEPNATTAEIEDAYESINDKHYPEDDVPLETLRSLWADVRTWYALKPYQTLTDPVKRSKYDRTLEVFNTPRYIDEVGRIRMVTHVLMGITIFLAVLTVPVWFVTPEMGKYVFHVGPFSWVWMILGIGVSIAISKIRDRIIRSRWSDLQGTVVIEELQKHASTMILWGWFSLLAGIILLLGLAMN